MKELSDQACIQIWWSKYRSWRHEKPTMRLKIIDAVFAHMFTGAEIPGKVGDELFDKVKGWTTDMKLYESGKAFSGSLGGAVGGSAKSAAKMGNSNASKTQAKHKQDTSKTQALNNENENKNNPPLSPEGGEPSAAGRFPAPISREQCVNLAADPIMSVQVPAEFAATWWDEHEHDGWTDDEGRPIRGMRRVRQLLAGAFKFRKNKSARAVDPVGGSARVFDPEACE